MNSIRCPQCSLINQTSALECQQCGFPFRNLPPTAYVSVPATEYERTVNLGAPPPRPEPPGLFSSFYEITPDNETGRKVHLWYRIWCGAFVVLSIIFIIVGFTIFGSPRGSFKTDEEKIFAGIFYIFLGIVTAALYAIALFSPRKPWSWIYGIVLQAFGIMSCCFLPSLILLIYWVKPETRAYFGRK